MAFSDCISVNGEAMVGFVYNSLLNDGYYGLLSKDGASTFENFLIRGNDPAYQMTLPPVVLKPRPRLSRARQPLAPAVSVKPSPALNSAVQLVAETPLRPPAPLP